MDVSHVLEMNFSKESVPAFCNTAPYGDSTIDLGTKDLDGSDLNFEDMESPDHISESDDSVVEFERKLHELMPDLHGKKDPITSEHPKGSRRSERPKKPPSRFIEEAEPPKSTKKKVSRGNNPEGTSSKHLLISDWSEYKLLNILMHLALALLIL